MPALLAAVDLMSAVTCPSEVAPRVEFLAVNNKELVWECAFSLALEPASDMASLSEMRGWTLMLTGRDEEGAFGGRKLLVGVSWRRGFFWGRSPSSRVGWVWGGRVVTVQGIGGGKNGHA